MDVDTNHKNVANLNMRYEVIMYFCRKARAEIDIYQNNNLKSGISKNMKMTIKRSRMIRNLHMLLLI